MTLFLPISPYSPVFIALLSIPHYTQIHIPKLSSYIFLCMQLDVLHIRPISYAVCVSKNTFLTFILHLSDIHLFLKLTQLRHYFIQEASVIPIALFLFLAFPSIITFHILLEFCKHISESQPVDYWFFYVRGYL